MRAGWNPGRRNRNAGTKAHGHGLNNKMTIPESWHEAKCFYEYLASYDVVKRRIAGCDLVFLVEPTRAGWFHPCTVEDVCFALSALPPEHVATFDLVVMRQPTRKQRLLSPVWGRAIFAFDVAEYSGAAIVLEAQNNEPVAWPLSLSPAEARELDRLRADGHEVRKSKRKLEIVTTPQSLRNTMLYRTLLHEVGHHVDHSQCPRDQWHGRTSLSKEDYAHRYATEALTKLRERGVVPFAQLLDADSLRQGGLQPE